MFFINSFNTSKYSLYIWVIRTQLIDLHSLSYGLDTQIPWLLSKCSKLVWSRRRKGFCRRFLNIYSHSENNTPSLNQKLIKSVKESTHPSLKHRQIHTKLSLDLPAFSGCVIDCRILKERLGIALPWYNPGSRAWLSTASSEKFPNISRKGTDWCWMKKNKEISNACNNFIYIHTLGILLSLPSCWS